MQTGDATRKLMPYVKQRGICIRKLRRAPQNLTCRSIALNGSEQFHCALRPHRPLPQQSAGKPHGSSVEPELHQQIRNDIIVISCVERDLLSTAAVDQGTANLYSLITVKRRYFNRPYVLNFAELTPELITEFTAANSRLQVKSKQGNMFGDFPA